MDCLRGNTFQIRVNVYRCQIGCHNKKGSGLLLILGAITKLEKQNHDPAIAAVILKRGAAEQARDDCLMRSVKMSSRTSTVRDDVCHVNTMDRLPNLEHNPTIQRSDCGVERRKTFAVEAGALARLPDIQRSFLSGAGYGNRTRLLGLGSRCTTDVLILHMNFLIARCAIYGNTPAARPPPCPCVCTLHRVLLL